MRHWHEGLSPARRRLTRLLVGVCLLAMPLYGLGFWQLGTHASGSRAQPLAETVGSDLPAAEPATPATTAPLAAAEVSDPAAEPSILATTTPAPVGVAVPRGSPSGRASRAGASGPRRPACPAAGCPAGARLG